jgi:hypothetical protein
MYTPALACDLYLNHGSLELLGDLVDDFFQAYLHAFNQYFAQVFRTPDYLIFAGIYNVAVTFEVMVRTHVLYYTTTNRILQTPFGVAHRRLTPAPTLRCGVSPLLKLGALRRVW